MNNYVQVWVIRIFMCYGPVYLSFLFDFCPGHHLQPGAQMRLYENNAAEGEDSASLTSIPLPQNSNFSASPTIHIRTVNYSSSR